MLIFWHEGHIRICQQLPHKCEKTTIIIQMDQAVNKAVIRNREKLSLSFPIFYRAAAMTKLRIATLPVSWDI